MKTSFPNDPKANFLRRDKSQEEIGKNCASFGWSDLMYPWLYHDGTPEYMVVIPWCSVTVVQCFLGTVCTRCSCSCDGVITRWRRFTGQQGRREPAGGRPSNSPPQDHHHHHHFCRHHHYLFHHCHYHWRWAIGWVDLQCTDAPSLVPNFNNRPEPPLTSTKTTTTSIIIIITIIIVIITNIIVSLSPWLVQKSGDVTIWRKNTAHFFPSIFKVNLHWNYTYFDYNCKRETSGWNWKSAFVFSPKGFSRQQQLWLGLLLM